MRFVVVEIPDNEEAEQFIGAVERGDLLFGFVKDNEDGTGEYGYKSITGAKVPAVYAVPTKFCECPDFDGKTVRTKAYGWNVHAKCSKPSRITGLYPINLREVNSTVKERVYFMSFRADRKSNWGVKAGERYEG